MPLAHILWLLVIVGAGSPAPDATGWWTPSAGIAWDIQLAIDPEANLVTPPEPIAAIDLDGGETRAGTVDILHQRGIRVLCYINAGAWEEWRPDALDYPEAILGNAYPGWPGERFVDIRALTVLGPILEARLDHCAALGFDAVEPDNIDTAYTDTGFTLTEHDQLLFNRWLAEQAHERGLAIFQKNVPELAANIVDTYDGAVTEDCAADGWCDAMVPYLDADKPVLAIEYRDVTDSGEYANMCTDPALEKFSLILKNRDLDVSRVVCDDRPVQSTRRSRAVRADETPRKTPPSMTIRIDDALITSQIAIPLQEGWVETEIPVAFSSRMRASEVGPDDVALISSAEATMLTTTHVIAPVVAVVMNGIGPIAMRTPVRPDEVEETMVRLYECGATAEILMRALLRSYFGITASSFAYIDQEQGDDEAQVVVVDDAVGLSQPESGHQVDLARAWFILTGQAVVSHVTVVGLEAQARGGGKELDVLRAAVGAGVERRKEVRGRIAERTGADRDALAEVTNRLRFELTLEDRIALANLAARGSWGSRFGHTIPVFRDALKVAHDAADGGS